MLSHHPKPHTSIRSPLNFEWTDRDGLKLVFSKEKCLLNSYKTLSVLGKENMCAHIGAFALKDLSCTGLCSCQASEMYRNFNTRLVMGDG